MKQLFLSGLALVLFALSSCAQGQQNSIIEQENNLDVTKMEGLKVATFGAGCFWCVEAIFQELKGVHKVASGYSGGYVKNPAYREVCNGTTGHAEVAQIHFDSTVISFEELTQVFFATHDPTTLNRQGADAGTQYRSAIFYHDENQKVVAEKVKKEFAPTLWDDPIVTEISAFDVFYEADDYHQNYFLENPNQPYCMIVINPKVRKFREKFADKLK